MGAGNLLGSGLGKLLQVDGATESIMLDVGGIGGLALGLSLAERTDYSPSDIALVANATAWGAWHGLWLGNALHVGDDDDVQRSSGGALFGAGLGTASGMFLSQFIERGGGDLVEANIAMGAGNLIGVGLGKLLQVNGTAENIMLDLGGIGGLALGLSFAGQTEYQTTDNVLVGLYGALLGAHGAGLHGMVSSDDQLDDDAIWGGALLGAGTGIATGMLLSQSLDISTGDLLEVSIATAAGDAIGFGLSRWANTDRQATLALVSTGGLGMLGLSTWLSQRTSYDTPDRVLTLYGAGWGAWLGGWAPLTGNSATHGLSGEAPTPKGT